MAESLMPLQQRGHARSVSAGGMAMITSPATSRPSALKKEHQRAFSHGQISSEDVGFTRGHSRIGSKTDFILPPGHRDADSKKGHSRQASRTESIYTLRQSSPPTKFDKFMSRIFGKTLTTDTESRSRTVVPNHLVPPRTPLSSHPNGNTPDNHIRTTKYTLLSFVPKNLLEQFHRFANLYFIFIVLLNWVPSINAFGKEIAMIPVMFVLGVTGIKDLFEDRRRYASDKRINNSTCRVYNGEEERYKKVFWKEVRVGDIVHLSNNEVVPADVLLLRSSDEHGTCYLDTCNLDGESNLKIRNVPQGYLEKQEGFTPSQFRSMVEVDPPTTKLYHFHGAIVDPEGGRTPVSTTHLLLRDSVIKNTDFVEGIVVYAGHETKAMLNNSGPRYKRSSLEKYMNRDIMWCVAILLVLCSIGSIGSKTWLSSFSTALPSILFIIGSASPAYEAWLTFWTFIIILQVMIPISLYVTIEMTKLLQVFHINNNINLYDAETNKRVECRALNITEQLGQIQYIFSDKTGTLTENKMIFRRCTIDGVDYNHQLSKAPQGSSDLAEIIPNQKLLDHLNESETDHSRKVKEFLIALALCNTVVVAAHPHHDKMNASGVIEGGSGDASIDEAQSSGQYKRLIENRSITPSPTSVIAEEVKDPFNESSQDTRLRARSAVIKAIPALSPISSSTESSPTSLVKQSPSRPKLLNVPSMLFSRKQKNGVTPKSNSQKPIFEAESPDELALVKMAYAYNCKLIKRTPMKAILSLPGESSTEYEILKILPFDSSRKCMSVVVRSPITREIVVYCKGADSAIFPKLVDPSAENATEGQINWYSSQGLRVLAVAKRILSEATWSSLNHGLESAEMSTVATNIRTAYSTVEKSLTLMGATGIEDRLQTGVSEAVSALRSAGIVMWVLTGDKIETARNVAVAAGLFTPNMEVFKLNARSRQSAENTILVYRSQIIGPSTDEGSSTSQTSPKTTLQRALIVDGKTLNYFLDRRANLTKPFLELTQHCSSVLCCRVTPLQKAYIVRVVKENLRMRTLAIGDGANDVSMIQAADVGIGISGQEGMQAVMASDFSLSRFRTLHRLLLVHGHWSYQRLSNMVLYFFYKNSLFVFLIFWYQLYCGFSGTVMIDQMYHMLLNLFFTALPPMAIGVYDQDAPEPLLMSRPYLYKIGRLGLSYTNYSFWITTADALYQSTAIFFIAVAAYNDSVIGIWEFGSTVTSSCMFAMLSQAALESRSMSIIHLGSIIVSLIIFFMFYYIYNNICMQCWGLPSNTWVLDTTLHDLTYWLVVLLSTVTALIPRLVIKAINNMLCPNEVIRAVIETNQARKRGDNFLVSWSRSTSTSSIYRTADPSTKVSTQATLTAVG